MFDSNLLDTIVGLVFVFMLVSVASSWFTEFIAQILRLRSHHLKEYLKEWIDEGKANQFVKRLYETNTIKALHKKKKGWRAGPSYISASDFVTGVIEAAITTEGGEIAEIQGDLDKYLKKNLPKTIYNPIGAMLHSTGKEISKIEDDFLAVRKSLETWFDSSMERLVGIYKRKVWAWGLVAAFILVTMTNADTIAISRALWINQDLRLAAAASAQAYVESVNQPDLPAVHTGDDLMHNGDYGDPLAEADQAASKIQEQLGELEELGLPIFWVLEELPEGEEDPYDQNLPRVWENGPLLRSKILGLSMTALAASFGAQIWFDLLKQLVNLRGSGPNPAEKANTKGNNQEKK